jgi:hypothetical protein
VTISKLHLLASIEPERAQKFIKKNRAQINKSSYRELKTIVHQIKLAPTKSVTLPTPAKQPIAELSFSPEVANHEVENCVEDIRENFARLKNVLKQKPIPKELLHLLKDIHQWSKSHVSKN